MVLVEGPPSPSFEHEGLLSQACLERPSACIGVGSTGTMNYTVEGRGISKSAFHSHPSCCRGTEVVYLYCEQNPGDIDTEMPYLFNNSETFFFHCCILGFSGQELTREIGNWWILAIFI